MEGYRMSGFSDQLANDREPQLPTDSSTLPMVDGPGAVRDRLTKLAVHVAGGHTSLLDGLVEEDRDLVLHEVGLIRRARLTRFLARAIAQDIHRERSLESL